MRPLLSILSFLALVLFGGPAQGQNCEFLCNTDFESDVQLGTAAFLFVDQNDVDCWRTTATDGLIEVWSTGFNGVPAYSGSQFVELNATQPSGLYQDFLAPQGSSVVISLAHRARIGPLDEMALEIGHDGVFVLIDQISDGLQWGLHTYNYTLPTGGTNTYTLRMTAISTGSGDLGAGNFLDAISVQLPSANPQVSLSGTNAGCPGANSGTITASVVQGAAPYSYAWAPSGGTGPAASGLAPGTYTCTVTDANGCHDEESVVITGWEAPVLSLSGTDVRCPGGTDGSASATVAQGTGPYSYSWTPGGATGPTLGHVGADTYSCTVTDAHGCTDQENVIISEPAALGLSTQNEVVCPGGTVTLQATASGGTPSYTYAWAPDGPTITPAASATYSVTVSDALGCTFGPVALEVEVPVFPDDPILTDTTFGCIPQCIGFSALNVPMNYDWDFGDGHAESGPAPTHCFTTAGAYDVSLTLTDANGCGRTWTRDSLITVWPLPSVRIRATATTVTIDQGTVGFTDVGQGSVQWDWSFGDEAGTTSTEEGPAFTYSTSGVYTVDLTGTNTYGCTATDVVAIEVRAPATAYIPNGFTPDGDGVNDSFGVSGSLPDLELFRFTVFDRWGQVLFSADSPDQRWSGADVPIGIYAWRLELTAGDAPRTERMGHVCLVR